MLEPLPALTNAAGLRAIGRYEVLFRIATGGMAEVYAARIRGEAGFQKLVALKRMHPHLATDEGFVAMFLDEGRVAANVSSPHVVSTIDLGRADDGSLYIVMELVVGVNLGTLLRNAFQRKTMIPLGVAIEIIAQAAQGLHDAHEATTPTGTPLEIIHRDVSPQNVLVGQDGRVRLTDFGIARAIMRLTRTHTGELKGKAGYFSPEQVDARPLDRRSDVFALGVVAWEALAGRRLFGKSSDAIIVLERVRSMPIPPLQQVRPEISLAISEVVGWALERNPSDRVQTAGQFADALRSAARNELALCTPKSVPQLVRDFGGDRLQQMLSGLDETVGTDRSVVIAGLARGSMAAPAPVETQTTPARPRATPPPGARLAAPSSAAAPIAEQPTQLTDEPPLLSEPPSPWLAETMVHDPEAQQPPPVGIIDSRLTPVGATLAVPIVSPATNPTMVIPRDSERYRALGTAAWLGVGSMVLFVVGASMVAILDIATRPDAPRRPILPQTNVMVVAPRPLAPQMPLAPPVVAAPPRPVGAYPPPAPVPEAVRALPPRAAPASARARARAPSEPATHARARAPSSGGSTDRQAAPPATAAAAQQEASTQTPPAQAAEQPRPQSAASRASPVVGVDAFDRALQRGSGASP